MVRLKEFSKFGNITRIRLVRDIITNISRGYAFIEYEEERDAEYAVRKADRMVIDDRIIFVDFECERLLLGWIPRRLGKELRCRITLLAFSTNSISHTLLLKVEVSVVKKNLDN